jgi:RES domain-containing protein
VPRSWRITKAKYAATAFDGEGARASGGRWNSPGIRIIYTAESRSLATLEILVHLNNSLLLSKYVLIPVDFPAESVMTLDVGSLPTNWRSYPSPPELQQLGDEWAKGQNSVVLQVPSIVVDGESNFLLNPDHPEFPSKVVVSSPQPFELDLRLLKTKRSDRVG